MLPSCQQFEARATETFEVSAADIQKLRCKTHNGRIELRGMAEADNVKVVVQKVVRASSQSKADDLLSELLISRDVANGVLDLHVYFADGRRRPSGVSASYSITGPMDLVGSLETHNGAVVVSNCGDELDAATHNGGIKVDGAYNRVALETHNGAIAVNFTGEGRVDGEIRTHNGGVFVGFSDACSSKVDASTHNGGIRSEGPVEVLSVRKRSVKAQIGDGLGALSVTTHNGGVVLTRNR